MPRVFRGWALGLALGLLTVPMGVSAHEDEESIPLSRVPKAVTKAIDEKFSGAEIVEASKYEEDGDTIYELSFKQDKVEYEVELKADGKFVEIEKYLSGKELPPAVVKALKSKYPRHKVQEAAEITDDDGVFYYVTIETGLKKELEILLDPSGKILEVDEVDEE